MIKTLLCTIIASSFMSVAAYAKCEINYDRTACAGKEKEAYSKCGGSKSCVKVEDAESEKECSDAAMKACANSRFDITKTKIIKAKWNGKELLSKSGADFCADYPNKDKEFNQCK